MSDLAKVVAKVLVLDGDESCHVHIQAFCAANNLQGLIVQADSVMSVLDANGDIAGVFLSENFSGEDADGIVLGQMICKSHPGLPLFLRRETSSRSDDLSEAESRPFEAVYTLDSIAELRPVMQQAFFSNTFPSALVQGLTAITTTALESQFINMRAESEAPHVVTDKVVFGEIFSLIPIETSWCRGYMMLQVEEESLVSLVRAKRTHARVEPFSDYGNLNGILSEITNLIWGGFKNRYMAESDIQKGYSQVPLVMNHYHSCISFGSDSPQLCLKYTVRDTEDAAAKSFVVYQKFIFNLKWNPQEFRENAIAEDEVDSGELEMF